jgi:hypothetical protein
MLDKKEGSAALTGLSNVISAASLMNLKGQEAGKKMTRTAQK